MNEYAGLHIAVWIDVAVMLAAGDAAVYKFSVILEVKYKERLKQIKDWKKVCCAAISDINE